ncbi:unnamed protein product, partial [Larinioides sclopetarius]
FLIGFCKKNDFFLSSLHQKFRLKTSKTQKSQHKGLYSVQLFWEYL